jgi:hypothetical protein
MSNELLLYLQHRTHDDNNAAETPFDFTEENYKIVKSVLAKYPSNYKQVGLLEHQKLHSLYISLFTKIQSTISVFSLPDLCSLALYPSWTLHNGSATTFCRWLL